MKKLFSGILIFLSISLQNSFSQEKSGPVITFDKTNIDFGERDYGPDVIMDFWFRNTGDEPLIVQSVKSSGGGSMVETWSKEPVKPNERGFVRVRYYGQRVGPTVKTFTVISNCTDLPAVVLGIKGKIREDERILIDGGPSPN